MIIAENRPTDRSSEAASLPWAAAEYVDLPLGGGLTLRAFVCRLGPARWHWTLNSLERDRAEEISRGVESSLSAAREVVASEIAKCLEPPA